jgi:hypothetical protein
MTEREINLAVEARDNQILDEMDEEEPEGEEDNPCRECRRRCRGSDCPLF